LGWQYLCLVHPVSYPKINLSRGTWLIVMGPSRALVLIWRLMVKISKLRCDRRKKWLGMNGCWKELSRTPRTD
jgi:hypothetical protein